MKATEVNYRRALDKIEELETQLHDALAKLARTEQDQTQQATETESMGKASLAVREEDVQQLAEYKKTNTALIEFVEKVADGRNKHRAEARKLLGLD